MKQKQNILRYGLLLGLLSCATISFAVRPNILFCIADDASMVSFGAYGGTVIETPAFDRLAEGGVLFRNAYNCNPKCSPARACLVTGRYTRLLEEELMEQQDPRTLGQGDIFDNYPRGKNRSKDKTRK